MSPRGFSEADARRYRRITSFALSEEQRDAIRTPPTAYPRQRSVLAVHWHPEFVPMELVRERVRATFPNSEQELVIPTQHNVMTSYDGEFSGVEVDCHARSFHRKVQLLVHLRSDRLAKADVLLAMLLHTSRYRAGQLYEFLDSVVEPRWDERVQRAARKTGADAELVAFVREHTARLRALVVANESTSPPEAMKNKLVRNYFDLLREELDDGLVSRAQLLLRHVKNVVKREFKLEYFYEAEQIIEEARGAGAGIVIPHPEQFWPILMCDYDVDGYEVWNPQSHEYTEFIVNVVNRQNRARRRTERPLLVFMGDDTHMGEKTRPKNLQDPEKAGREVGVQPGWDDLAIRKSLFIANATRQRVIDEYRARLAG